MQPLRILQIEDSQSDADLIVRLLAKSGYQVESERAENGEQLRQALARANWDVVIADFRLPQFDAPSALRILQESGADIPFIIVSANIGEEMAVQMMKSGAHDYVMKANMARLPPVIEREVNEARARRARRQAEESLALAISVAQLGTFDYHPQTGEFIWSDTVRQQFGVGPDVVPSYDLFLQALHPGDRDRVHRVMQASLRRHGGGQLVTEFRTIGIEDRVERYLSAKGRTMFDALDRPLRMAGVILDVTERRSLEEQFRQAQKLESIGRLAGGVAHDFNNLLTVITGYSEMVQDEMPTHHPLHESVRQISRAADRATALTRQLLAFSRRQVSEPKVFAINQLVQDFEKMLGRLIGEDIEMTLVLAPDAGCLRADPLHIEQVIMNLVVNARDAMPKGGQLVIKTGRRVLDESHAEKYFSLASGNYVTLSISDTGVGMSPDVKSQIFEPFFTTKEHGKGTGLGLSTVYGIVKQSEGAISVYSEPGQGTTFQLLFPATDEEASEIREAPSGVKAKGQGTILLAEDEPGVRDFLRQALTKSGYTVLAAPDGREALKIAQQHHGTINLLLTDITMPGLGGVELATRFQVNRPGTPVVLMSGYVEELADLQSLHATYLQKPVSSASLIAQVRAILSENSNITSH